MSLAGDLAPPLLALVAGGAGYWLARGSRGAVAVSPSETAAATRVLDPEQQAREEAQANEAEVKAGRIAELESRLETARAELVEAEQQLQARRATFESELEERVRQAETRIDEAQRAAIDQAKAAAVEVAMRETVEMTVKMVKQFVAESLKSKSSPETRALEAESGAAAGE